MVLITQSGPDTLPLGEGAPSFSLPGTDGKNHTLEQLVGAKGFVLSFTCNHCPYAVAYEDRFIALARAFQPQGVGFAAICSNNAVTHPGDGFEAMQVRAREKNFPFPYLRDESQAVARAYGAVCTPHLFAFDAARKLVYEGRIDDNWKDPSAAKAHDLRNALEALVAGRPVPVPRTSPMGCSIKWIG